MHVYIKALNDDADNYFQNFSFTHNENVWVC